MALGHLLVLIALAPPEAAESSRAYMGVDAVVARKDATPTERIDAKAPLEAAAEAPDDEVHTVGAGPLPRILTTTQGWYPGEEAKHWNEAGTFSFVPGMQVRSRVGAVAPFRIDESGHTHDDGASAAGRVRWRPVFGFGRHQAVHLVGMLDVANGRWTPRRSNDPIIREIIDVGQPPQPSGIRAIEMRELFIDWQTRYGRLLVGQMSFVWGLGLLANDGNNLDRFGDLRFGDDGDGSLQERIMLATKPLASSGGPGKDITLAAGADLIYRDPNADLLAGDLAGQAFLIVRYEPEHRPGQWLGVYGVYRRQRSADAHDVHSDDDLLEYGVADFSGQGVHYLRRKLALIGAFEALAKAGRTTMATGRFREHQILQGAAALRGYIGDPRRWLAGFDAGWASGDANPEDQEINEFRADPGYRVGLLLFDHVLGWQSARAQLRARDPNLGAQPQDGTQFIPTRGSFTNAVYVHPLARYALWERLEIWGGPLLAASAVPAVDPVNTRQRGGVPTNTLGGASERRYLGTELDFGIRGRYAFEQLWVQAGVQTGVFFPGPALRDAEGRTDGAIWGAWFRAEIRY